VGVGLGKARNKLKIRKKYEPQKERRVEAEGYYLTIEHKRKKSTDLVEKNEKQHHFSVR